MIAGKHVLGFLALQSILLGGTQPSQIAMTPDPNSSVYGHSFTLAANVTPAAASGSVTFYVGTIPLGTSQLSGGHASFSTILLPTGTSSLTAHYEGDAVYAPSKSGPVSQTVVTHTGGAFTGPNPYFAYEPGSTVVADMNGDGKADLAIAGSPFASVSVLLGNGDGTFQDQGRLYNVPGGGGYQSNIVTADFNGDGKPDIAVPGSGGVLVFLGNGDGTLQTGVNSVTGAGTAPVTLAVGDFNGDGKPDLAVANFISAFSQTDQMNEGSVTILLGNGDGTFQSPVSYATAPSPVFVAVADLNRDGNADLVVAPLDGTLTALLGTGTGSFHAVSPLTQTLGGFGQCMTDRESVALAVGDFNGDGIVDVAFTTDAESAAALGNGDGTFQSPSCTASPDNNSGVGGPMYSQVIDFNGDGKLDLAIASGGAVIIVPGNGDGTFQNGVPFLGTLQRGGLGLHGLAVGDFNGDGIADIAAADYSSSVNILLGAVGPTSVSQTISFGPLANVSYGVAPFAISAMASSGLPIGFTSTTASVCTVLGSTVTILSAGMCSITASQSGNYTYAPASTSQSFRVNPEGQTITFAPLSDLILGAPAFSLSATASSGLTVTFASTTTGVCTISGTQVVVIAAGTCSITASQAGNATYAAASSVVQSFTVGKEAETITFGSLSNMTLTASPIQLSAVASSGLPVTLTSNTTAVCTVAGVMLTLVTSGTCSITASQAGNANYAAAASVVQSFTVGNGTETITFGPLSSLPLSASPIQLSAAASSGLPVTFTSNTTAVCIVSGVTLTLVAPGTCSITASQAGNANYAAAASVVQSFTVGKGTEAITFGSPGSLPLSASPIPLSAVASSGLPVTFTSNTTAVCTVAGVILTLVTSGTCSITASQPGNANYNAATPVTQTFEVSAASAAKMSQTITFDAERSPSLGMPPIQLMASASSGLAVVFTSNSPAICTASGTAATLVAAGDCSITARQPGNAVYAAAAPVTRVFPVGCGSQCTAYPAQRRPPR